jgi:hypothetical protein
MAHILLYSYGYQLVSQTFYDFELQDSQKVMEYPISIE